MRRPPRLPAQLLRGKSSCLSISHVAAVWKSITTDASQGAEDIGVAILLAPLASAERRFNTVQPPLSLSLKRNTLST
jgi:hypothetical protein